MTDLEADWKRIRLYIDVFQLGMQKWRCKAREDLTEGTLRIQTVVPHKRLYIDVFQSGNAKMEMQSQGEPD